MGTSPHPNLNIVFFRVLGYPRANRGLFASRILTEDALTLEGIVDDTVRLGREDMQVRFWIFKTGLSFSPPNFIGEVLGVGWGELWSILGNCPD